MKGVSHNDAHNDQKNKGITKNVKKPLQVLHISKKDDHSNEVEIFDEKN